jgi:hypothetical protein
MDRWTLLARTSSLIYALLLATCLSACASIQSFQAKPRNVCAGDDVTVSWQASVPVELSAKPTLPGTGRMPPSGTATFPVAKPTQFVLTAPRLFGGDLTAEADIQVAPEVQTFGNIASCSADERALSTVFALTDQLAPTFVVKSVRNAFPRELIVRKDDRAARLAPGETSGTLRNTPVLGTWRLDAPLGPGESCDAALRSVRQRLSVEIHLDCGG